jgi:hypothetical protein
MEQYPSIEMAFPYQCRDRLTALGHTEERRLNIAKSADLEMLALSDQYVRAIYELGIDSPENASNAHSAIESALAFFQFRGFSTGDSPSPKAIKKAIKRIARSAENIQADLNLLMMARRDIGINEQTRADSLEQIQHTILGSFVANVLPASIRNKISDDEIAAAMPTITSTANAFGFSSEWEGGFSKLANTANSIADAFTLAELSKPTRTYDVHLARFIGHLAAIFELWTGSAPHSPDRNVNQPSDWRGPFSRFVAAVWPLTPEGSGGLGNNRRCPTNKQIRKALKQSVLLTAENASQ